MAFVMLALLIRSIGHPGRANRGRPLLRQRRSTHRHGRGRCHSQFTRLDEARHRDRSIRSRVQVGTRGLQEPEFFSRSGSFRFNSSHAEERIREAVPSAERFPTLRLAEVVDPAKAARLDPTLTELMEWATLSFACSAIRMSPSGSPTTWPRSLRSSFSSRLTSVAFLSKTERIAT